MTRRKKDDVLSARMIEYLTTRVIDETDPAFLKLVDFERNEIQARLKFYTSHGLSMEACFVACEAAARETDRDIARHIAFRYGVPLSVGEKALNGLESRRAYAVALQQLRRSGIRGGYGEVDDA